MTQTPDHWSELEEIALLFAGLFHHTHKTVSVARRHSGTTDRLNSYPYRIIGLLAREGPLPVTEIGVRLDIAKSNVSACVNKQVSVGNLERIPGVADRRVVMIGITKNGRAEVEAAHAMTTKVIAQYFSRLTAKERKTLKKNIAAISEILERQYF